MIKNYLKTAWRNLVRNKAFSFINLFGLSLGITCSLLIFLWVQDERSVDTFNTDKNIYSVYERVYSEGKVNASRETPALLATELKRNLPEIKYASSFWNAQEILFSANNKNVNEKGCYADSDYFKIFRYSLIEGNKASALIQPEDIAISKRMATTFFASPEAAIGKTIRYNDILNFKVSAVFDDTFTNASEKFDYVINWQYLLKTVGVLNQWTYRSPYTFIQLQPDADPKKVQAKIKNFLKPYVSFRNEKGSQAELGLQRFDNMYLNSTFKNGIPDGGRIEYVRLFSIIAIFILLIACINFMNLSTARAVKRAKEVGIRKTIGARRFRLIMQFGGEAILLTFLALSAALILVIIALPYFNNLTSKQIVFPFSSASFWLAILSLLCVTGFVAGSYPALFLSSLNPVKVLKGALKFSPKVLLFRRILVVFQFVLSIIIIIGTIVISKQIRYVQNANLGYDKENLIYIPIERDLGSKYSLFKQQLSSFPSIKLITYSNQIPTQIGAHAYNLDWDGKSPDIKADVIYNSVGYDYSKTMNLQLLMGRDFSKDFSFDTTGYLINETALKMISYNNPIGKTLTLSEHRGHIIGVIKDFHFQSLHDPVQPIVISFSGENISWDGGFVIVRTERGKTQQAIADIEKLFKEMEPKFPFRYYFADEEYQKLYTSEITVSKLSNSFSFLAIIISCLGLLGLTMFTAEQRKKEIGVRKVIGASVSDIVIMLSKDIVKLVMLAAIIATPIAWLAMNNWLQNYAYRISISWWIFLTAGVIALFIAVITVSFQAIKAAIANPIKSLRSE